MRLGRRRLAVYRWRWRLAKCSGYLSKKSAKSRKNHHIREKHERGGSALAERRKPRDAHAHLGQREFNRG